MEKKLPTDSFQREPISRFIFDPEKNFYVHPDNCTIDYQDGGEAYILESMKKVNDLSSHSPEFRQYIKDWPSRYHFSLKRVNFLEGIKEVLPKNADVLEIGSGCGTITRWLGEQFHSVDALEGNTQRAIITRYRTKDLENVKVYCGNLLDTDFDKKYDVITLIGSLEYLPFYDTEHDDPKEACSVLLTRLRGSLKDDGILLVAIENKFGAKYFTGCKEDHTGREFDGIIGYPDKTPVTFSRNEMGSMLSQTGFGHNQFYHVFPDYKMTEIIIPEKTEVLSLHPHSWIRTPFEDYTGDRLHLFPDLLFLKSIIDAGLLWQFSNSFVIVATMTNEFDLNVPWLIKGYRNYENLDPKFHHEITLVGDLLPSGSEKKYRVVRASLYGSDQPDHPEEFEFRLNNNEYVHGELLINDIFTALFKRSPEQELRQQLTRFYDCLLQAYALGKTDSEGYDLIAGEAIDYTFWNIIFGKNHELIFFDRKWTYKDSLPADVILFRNLFWIFERISPFLTNKNKRSFILEMIRSIYPYYPEKRLSAALDFENHFQAYVAAKHQNYTFDSPVQYSLPDQVLKIDSLNRSLADQASKIDSLNRSLPYQTSKIDSVEQSIIWQFIMKFNNNIINRLLPHHSRRRRYYDLGMSGGKILINEGWRSFWWRFNRIRTHNNRFPWKKGCISETIVSFRQTPNVKCIDTTISVIIPTKNAGHGFDYVLNKIRSQKGINQLEIVIVDSGSTDDTLEIAKKYHATVLRIKPEEFDHGKTRNLGALQSTGEYILFTTQDALFAGDSFVYTMVNFFHNDNKIAAVTCRQVPRSDADLMACYQVWSHYYKFLNIDSDKIVAASNFTIPSKEKRKLANLSDSGCCFKRELFLQYQYKKNFAEDLELGLRLLKDGYKLAYLYNAAIIHSHNRTAAYFFKANYTDSKCVSQILENLPLPWDIEHAEDFFETIRHVYSKVSHALITVQQSSFQDPVKFIRSLEQQMRRDCLSTEGLVSSGNLMFRDETLDVLFRDIKRLFPDITDPKSDPDLSFILTNNFIDALEAFAGYCENYKTIEDINTDFITTIFKLFAGSAASSLGNFVVYLETYNKTDSASKQLDEFLRKGV